MIELKIKRIRLNEDNNDLIYQYLPKHYLEIKKIKNVEDPLKKYLLESLENAKTEKEKERINKKLASLNFIKEVHYTVMSNISYEDLVNKLIRERYTESEEFAILRKAINGNIEDYTVYNAYAEQCKAQAKQWCIQRDKTLGGNN